MPWTEITRQQYRRDELRYASDLTDCSDGGGSRQKPKPATSWAITNEHRHRRGDTYSILRRDHTPRGQSLPSLPARSAGRLAADRAVGNMIGPAMRRPRRRMLRLTHRTTSISL